MDLIDRLSSKATDKKLTQKLVNFVYDRVQNEHGIRVEDAICTVATIVGERCIECANEYSIDEHDLKPGTVVFSEKMNEVLIGASTVNSWTELSKKSAFGSIREKLGSQFTAQDFPELLDIFKKHAANSGNVAWGNVPLSVAKSHQPSVLPIRVGYETRKYLQKNINLWSAEKSLQISIDALVQILTDSKTVIAPKVALLLSFETINGMSKTAPMTDKKLKELSQNKKN